MHILYLYLCIVKCTFIIVHWRTYIYVSTLYTEQLHLYIVHYKYNCTLYNEQSSMFTLYRLLLHCCTMNSDRYLYNLQCTIIPNHCTVYINTYTMYTVQLHMFIVHCTFAHVNCTLYICTCPLYTVQLHMSLVHCTVAHVCCTLYSCKCAFCTVQ